MDFKKGAFLFRGIVLLCLTGLCCITYRITGLMSSIKLSSDMYGKQMHVESYTGEIAKPSDVLILTYMRSGSTFIGKLLGWRIDTFYWYEPLRETLKYEYISEDGQVCSYGKPYCRNAADTDPKSLKTALNFLSSIYQCNFWQNSTGKHLRFPGMLHVHAYRTGPTGKVFSDCRSNVQGNCTKCKSSPLSCKNCKTFSKKCKACSSWSLLKPCYKRLTDRCAPSAHIVTKVLRIATANAKYLLSQHKRLKLIQIFRDPRATLNSRRRRDSYYIPKNNFTLLQDAVTLCERIEKDLAAAQDLQRLFPGRVKILQYEDFKDPFRVGKLLYSFLNMKLTRTSKSLLTEPPANESLGGFHPDSFRYHLDWHTVQHIDRTCHKVLKSLGLWIFKSKEELLNTRLDIVSGSRPYALKN